MLVFLGVATIIGGKVLDLLFGKAEPFEYEGTTTLGDH